MVSWREAGRRGLIAIVGLAAVALATAAAPPKADWARHDQARTQALRRILAAPAFQQGFFGVYVYSLDRRRVLFNHDGDHYFTPASNAKLFTLATALRLLGPDFRFHTAAVAAAPPDASGLVTGDVAWIGVGDPSLSGRPYPYRPDPRAPALPYDPELVPQRLAAAIAARGVRRITGNIVGDDSYFPDAPYPSGWAISDEVWDYGAPVAALTLNDNTRFLQVFPGVGVGDAARLVFTPALDPPAMLNGAVTVAAGGRTQLRLGADPLTGGLRLQGGIAVGSPGVLEALAVRQPALYAAELLRQALIERGVVVDGVARARHLAPAAGAAPESYELAGRDSPPLAEILQATAKVSQNLEAELMLRVLGKLRTAPAPAAARGGGRGAPEPGTSAAGEAVVRAFLQDAGLGARDDALVDGSGLSRTDLVTPAGVVRLLTYMAQRPEGAVWRALLPVAGRDGTLEHRFTGTGVAGRLSAKTGSLSHVNSLSGYLTARDGERLVFSLLSNNVNRPAPAVRQQLDRLAEAIAEQ
ncbi:MAG: D-alanyl-D-alanine carboxypeptidase/D-alanyl-D-alanine endopeptidase [Terriglobales bacterium]